jgi:hypothetical protein
MPVRNTLAYLRQTMKENEKSLIKVIIGPVVNTFSHHKLLASNEHSSLLHFTLTYYAGALMTPAYLCLNIHQ